MANTEKTKEQLLDEVASLRESVERFRMIVGTTPVPLAITKRSDGTILFANRAFSDLFGYPLEKLIGQQTPPLYYDPSERADMLAAQAEKGSFYDYEIRLKKSDGTIFLGNVTVEPINFEGEQALFAAVVDITERKQVEGELKASHANLAALMENTDDYILISDEEGLPVAFNSAYARIMKGALGIEMKPGLQPHKLLPDEEQVAWWDNLHQRVLGGEKFRMEYSLELEENNIRHFELSYHPIIVDGVVKGFSEIARDITERKQAEEALQKIERNLSHAQQIVHLGSWERDFETGAEWWSKEHFRTFGYEPGEIAPTFDTFMDAVHPDDHDTVLSAIQDVLKGTRPYDIEIRIIRPDGTERIINAQGQAHRDEKGEPTRLVGTALDITDRKQMEEALRASEERYRLLIETMTDGLGIRDNNHNITFANDRLCEMMGYSRDEYVGRRVTDFLSDESRFLFESLGTKRQSNQLESYELEMIRKDGQTIHGFVSPRILFDADGNLDGSFAVITDITELKKVQEALEQRNRELALLNKVIATAASTLKGEEVLEVACRELALAFDASRAVAVLLDENNSTTRVAAEYTSDGQPSVLGYVTSLEDSLGLQYILEHKAPLVASDAQNDPRLALIPSWAKQPGSASGMLLPLMVRDQVVGAIGLVTTPLHEFTDQETELSANVATAVGQALHNASLFKAERDQRALAEALRDTAAALNSTLDVDEVLEGILEDVGRVVLHDAADIMLVKDGSARIVHSRGYAEEEREEMVPDIQFSVAETPNMQRMVETGRPLAVPNVQAHPDWVDHPETPDWIHSYAGAPIRLKDGKVIGFINLNSQQPDFYTPDHADRLQAFADQAAVAMQNARLFEQVQRHADQLETLRRATLDMTSRLEPNAVLDMLVRNGLELLGAQGGTMFLHQPERDVLEAIFSVHSTRELAGAEVKRGEGLSGRVWESGEPLIVDNYAEWEGRLLLLKNTNPVSVLGVPIQWGDEFLGVLTAVGKVGSFSENDVRLLSLFALQAAVAVRNAQLFQQEQRQAFRLEVLRRVTLDITSQLDQGALLRTIIENANSLLGVKAGSIYLYRAERNVLEWAVTVGEDQAPLESVLKRGEGLSGKVWEGREPLLVDRYADWEGRAASLGGHEWTAVIGVPIHWGEEFLGTFTALADTPERTFSEDDVHLLSLLASQAAVAIKNARLYEATLEVTEELKEQVTERTLELTRARQRAEVILRSVGEPVVVFNTDGDIQAGNPAFEREFGPVTQDENPVNISAFFPGGEIPKHIAKQAGISIGAGWVWRDEVAIIRRDGTPYDAAVTVTPLDNEEGDTDIYVGSVRDISHLKEVDRLKQKFMELVQHEMRTPLTSIKGFSSMLLAGDAGPLEDKAQEYAGFIEGSADRLTSIVNDIIRVMRIYSGEVTADMQPIDLCEVVELVVEAAQPDAQQNEQRITIKVARDLPPLAADREHLSQVLSHLVNNAVTYAGQGCQIEIDANYANSGDDPPHLVVRVMDNGRGISPADQERLYEPFFRVRDPATQHKSGSGLGLYIVEALAELYGGTTKVESKVGEGSIFYLTWPIQTE
jgi:PAS domain S-box-containing protein